MRQMDERKISILTIRRLEQYFREEFTDASDEHLDTFAYALDAWETLVDNIKDLTKEYKQFEYLTSRATYESFKEVLENDFIDEIVDIFEAR